MTSNFSILIEKMLNDKDVNMDEINYIRDIMNRGFKSLQDIRDNVSHNIQLLEEIPQPDIEDPVENFIETCRTFSKIYDIIGEEVALYVKVREIYDRHTFSS